MYKNQQVFQANRGRRSFRGGRRAFNNRVNRNRQFRKKKSKLTLFQSIAKSAYNLITALPFVPAPVKSIADVVAHQFGIANSITGSNNVAATPNVICFYFELSVKSLILGSPLIVEDSPNDLYKTNFRTARPMTWTVSVIPTGRVQSREGFLFVAMFPYTSDLSALDYRAFDKTGLPLNDFIARAPVKKRAPATQTITLSYQVPRNNAFLNKGFNLATAADSSGVCAVYVGFEMNDRDSYDDFKPSDFSVEIKINGQAKLGDANPTMPTKFSSESVVDLLKNLPNRIFALKENKKIVMLDGDSFVYNDTNNYMSGGKKELKRERDVVTLDYEMVDNLSI